MRARTFVWDTVTGSLPVLLSDGDHRYLYGTGTTPLAQVNTQTGARQYLHTDTTGNVRTLTNAAGDEIARYDYDLYGTRTRAAAGTTSAGTSFGYAGEYTDPTGLIYLRARYYDPTTASFISVDPLLGATGSPYGYTTGNPLQESDPTGLMPKWADRSLDATAVFLEDTFYDTDGNYIPWEATKAYATGATNATITLIPNTAAFLANNTPPASVLIMTGLIPAMPYLDAPLDKPNCNDIYNLSGTIGEWAGPQLLIGGPLGKAGKAGQATHAGVNAARASRGSRLARFFGKGCLRSFSGNTPVLMDDGNHRPINQIQPGDQVLATDPITGEQSPAAVTAVWVHPDQLVDLTITDTVITTTADHPFWSATDHTWERADQLTPGEHVQTADGTHQPVTGLTDTNHTADAYNLTIANLHTYHVSTTDTLVHNCGDAAKAAESGTRIFVATPRGTIYDVSHNWVPRAADKGKGIVYQQAGSQGNADMVRIMEPTPKYPNGYARVHNSHGQPVDVFGKPGPPSTTHIPEDYRGPWPGWPR